MIIAIITSNNCHALRDVINGENTLAPKAKEKKKIILAKQAPIPNWRVSSKRIETVPINTNVSM